MSVINGSTIEFQNERSNCNPRAPPLFFSWNKNYIFLSFGKKKTHILIAIISIRSLANQMKIDRRKEVCLDEMIYLYGYTMLLSVFNVGKLTKRGRGTSRLRGHLFANIRVNEFSSGSLWWRRRNNERRSRGGSGKQREIVGNYSTVSRRN